MTNSRAVLTLTTALLLLVAACNRKQQAPGSTTSEIDVFFAGETLVELAHDTKDVDAKVSILPSLPTADDISDQTNKSYTSSIADNSYAWVLVS